MFRSRSAFLSYVLALSCSIALLAGSGCREKAPTREECAASFQNFLRLYSEGVLDEHEIERMASGPMEKQLTELCTQRKTRRQVRCEIDAENWQELRACADSGPGKGWPFPGAAGGNSSE